MIQYDKYAEVIHYEKNCMSVRWWQKRAFPKYRFPALNSDYEAMKEMLYGDIPSFNTIMESVRQLEKEINSL